VHIQVKQEGRLVDIISEDGCTAQFERMRLPPWNMFGCAHCDLEAYCSTACIAVSLKCDPGAESPVVFMRKSADG
jgi:hypothetical protein